MSHVSVPGWRVEVVPLTGSTNSDVAERARSGEPAGLVITANHQNAARGRLDRTWVAPEGTTLAFSALIRPEVPTERWPWLPLATGLAVIRGVRKATGLAGVTLKWPNDVLLIDEQGESRKLCGILLERVESPVGPAAVLGVGINVGMTREQLPVPTATSLAIAGADVTREELLAAILAELAAALDTWSDDPDQLRRDYGSECDTVGRVVDVSLPDGSTVTGRVAGIDESGRLDLETDGGQVRVGAGDVVHVRPGG